MTERGALAECPNVLCDYDEEIADAEVALTTRGAFRSAGR
ncbi:MAG: hypothetical protein Kow0025_13890 [Thermodesulfovibrionales bacterium]